jgi:hypothetical protein
MNAIKIRLIFKRSLAVAPFAMLGLLLAVNAAVAQESQKPDSLTVLVAPIYYDINSKQVEHDLITGTEDYLKKALDRFNKQNPQVRFLVMLDPEELGYNLWKEHEFDSMGFSRPKRERMKAAGITAGAQVVLTLSVHYQMGFDINDTYSFVQLFLYDSQDGTLQDFDEEIKNVPVANVYYSVEELADEALANMGKAEPEEEAAEGPASQSGER